VPVKAVLAEGFPENVADAQFKVLIVADPEGVASSCVLHRIKRKIEKMILVIKKFFFIMISNGCLFSYKKLSMF
jgi:hypothetical protein